jgi:hypothetical protein
MNKTTVQYNGIGFVGLLTLLFITLKLTGYLTWSWLWVLSPLWIAPLVGITAGLLIFAGVVLWAWKTTK